MPSITRATRTTSSTSGNDPHGAGGRSSSIGLRGGRRRGLRGLRRGRGAAVWRRRGPPRARLAALLGHQTRVWRRSPGAEAPRLTDNPTRPGPATSPSACRGCPSAAASASACTRGRRCPGWRRSPSGVLRGSAIIRSIRPRLASSTSAWRPSSAWASRSRRASASRTRSSSPVDSTRGPPTAPTRHSNPRRGKAEANSSPSRRSRSAICRRRSSRASRSALSADLGARRRTPPIRSVRALRARSSFRPVAYEGS